MEGETVENLINKYLEGKASVEEINQLNKWYDLFDSKPDMYLPGSLKSDRAAAKKLSELKLKLGIN